MTEFKLSDKIEDLTGGNAIDFYENVSSALDVEDVKEFIEKLKKFCKDNECHNVIEEIDKLVGELG